MTTKDRLFQNYLRGHSDLPRDFEFSNCPRFSDIVVVPARNEGNFFFKRTLPSLKKASEKRFEQSGLPVFICIVANGRVSDSNEEILLQESFLEKFSKPVKTQMFNWVETSESFRIGLFNFISPPFRFEPKQGVGLARKIGCDLAVSLFDRGLLNSTVVFTTDSDAEVPESYFCWDREILSPGGIAVLPFKHVPDDSQIAPPEFAALFDSYLENYRLGLLFAASPFAFTALGSALCINLKTYVQVRGMPKLLAGEDFYICQKIAKFSQVFHPRGDPILLQARFSDRVPFGTGPRMVSWKNFLDEKGLEKNKATNFNEICFENPACFAELKKVRLLLRDLRKNFYRSCDFPIPLHPRTLEFLSTEKILERLKGGLQNKTNAGVFEKLEREIFDGLTEIRLINFLGQVEEFKALPYASALGLFSEMKKNYCEADDMVLIHKRMVSASSAGMSEPVGGILPTPAPPIMR